MDGPTTDAGRQSLPDGGGGGAHAPACRLCGVGNPPSAHYCVNCGAILKPAAGAARAPGPVPVASTTPPARTGSNDLPPLPGALATVGGDPAPRAGEQARGGAAAGDGRGAAAGGERMVAWIALGVLVVAAVFFLQRIVSMSFDRTVRDAPPATTTSSAAAFLAAQPAASSEPEPAAPAPEAVVAPPPAAVPPPVRAEPLKSEEVSAANAARSLVPVRPSARPAPAAAEEPIEPLPAAVLPPAPPPVAAPEPPPVVVAQQAPARSRWERMHDEIAACRGNFFEKVACEHGIRARYCDGWYGRADECPSGRTADYGN